MILLHDTQVETRVVPRPRLSSRLQLEQDLSERPMAEFTRFCGPANVTALADFVNAGHGHALAVTQPGGIFRAPVPGAAAGRMQGPAARTSTTHLFWLRGCCNQWHACPWL
jgi:hypothetical protein